MVLPIVTRTKPPCRNFNSSGRNSNLNDCDFIDQMSCRFLSIFYLRLQFNSISKCTLIVLYATVEIQSQ